MFYTLTAIVLFGCSEESLTQALVQYQLQSRNAADKENEAFAVELNAIYSDEISEWLPL